MVLAIDGIPTAAQPLWQRLLGEPLLPVHELFAEVHRYQATLDQHADWEQSQVDGTLARELTRTALSLLGTLADETPEPTRRLVQAAVRYLLIDEDADADLGSILGLDDDAEVMNAVLRHLGYADWLVTIP